MPITYDKIATTTVSGTPSDVTFSSISGSYTDLVMVCQMKTSALATIYLQFNSDTSSNYSYTNLAGSPAGVNSGRASNANFSRITNYAYPDNTFNTNAIVNFMNYSNTTTNKTFLSRANNASGTDNATEVLVSLWRSTAAISTIKVYPSGGATWSAGSTFTIYGILKA